MAIHTIITAGLSIRSYVVIDESSGNAIVIDPTRLVDPIISYLKENKASLRFILETHVHADFLSGAKELKSRWNNEPIICCSNMGGKEWIPQYNDKEISNHEILSLGSVKFKAFHTPGHTLEHQSFVMEINGQPTAFFTGDFLLAGSLGRPDLINIKMTQSLLKGLYHSVFDVLPQFSNTLPIYPAHGAGSLCGKGIGSENSTLENEWAHNPSLIKTSFEEWSKKLLEGLPKAPRYFSVMKKMNVSGAPLLKDVAKPKKMTLEDISKINFSDFFVLDTRNQEVFAQGHIQKAVNIPWGPLFTRWIGEFIPYDTPIIIFSSSEEEAVQSINGLYLIGLDNIFGYAVVDQEFLYKNKNQITAFQMIEGSEVLTKLNLGLEVIDVRTDAEWNAGHIPTAKHLEIVNLMDALEEIPKNQHIVFVCGSGYRASIAASVAQKFGSPHVCNIKGGMQAWQKAQLPMEKN